MDLSTVFWRFFLSREFPIMGNYAKSAAVAILGGIAMYFSFDSQNKIGKGKKSIDDDVKVDDPPVGPTLVKVAFVS